MINWNEEENLYDYSPNELARLSIENNKKYRDVVGSNLTNSTVEEWEKRNLNYMQDFIKRNIS